MPRHLLLLNCLACLWCCLVLNVRVYLTGHYYYVFLLWNLFLAAIPLGLSLGLKRVNRPSRAAPLLAVWLLFFPNAPYVLTDLIHLAPQGHPKVPQWLDLLMLLSFALVSLWLGFQSLRMVQHWVEERSSKRVAWGMIFGVLGLSGFGVYLGRFLRWNSWDILRRPHLLLEDILARVFNPLQYFQTWSFTVGFGILLMLAYLFWVSAMHAPQMQAERANGEFDKA